MQLYRSGGVASDTAGEIIVLHAMAVTNSNVSTFRKAGAWSAGYQVTAGKALYIAKIAFWYDATSSANSWSLGYADNDVGMNTTTARTSPVAVLGNPELHSGVGSDMNSAGYFHGADAGNVTSIANRAWDGCNFRAIPATTPGKYLYMRHFTGGSQITMVIHAYEV